jgi:release factor glutamine methyltransferase
MTISEWLSDASRQLKLAEVPSHRLDAEIILAHTLNVPRTHLHAHLDDAVSDRSHEIADARLDLRLDHVPVAYIIGHKEFYGRRFTVNTATLIPRPESEVMIDLLKEVMPTNTSILTETKRLVDVGTGSGALGVTAKLTWPELDVTLLDVSRHALNVAEKNAALHHVEVETILSDLLTNYPYQADYILANLPYVDQSWDVSPELQHEPALALFAGQEGLALIFRLLAQVPQTLSPSGFLFIEADPVQHDAIIAEAKKHRLILHTQRDYQLVLQAL